MVRIRRTSEPSSLSLEGTRVLADAGHTQINHPLGIENKILGYVYLVDQNAKIRWAGNAMATEQEAQNLRRAAGVLMTRMQDKGHQASSVEPATL